MKPIAPPLSALLPLLLLGALSTPVAVQAGDAPADTRVVAFTVKQPYVYEQADDRFKRIGPLDTAAVAPPLKVLSVSKKGYVEVETATGPVWLDKMDVKLDPPASLWQKANCNRRVTTTASVKSHVGMGAGEGCTQ